MATTVKAPSGLSMKRSGNNYKLSWKQGDDYTSQELYYQINRTGKNSVTIYSDTTETTIPINKNNYYPKTDTRLNSIRFYVRGKKDGVWSSYTSYEETIYVPFSPTLTAEWNPDDEHENRTVFSWNIPWKQNGKNVSTAIFTNCKWWTALLSNSGTSPQYVKDWQHWNITTDDEDSGSFQYDETRVFENNYSYTRYFKMVARGPHGESDPVYAKHVYAFPIAPHDVSAKVTRLKNGTAHSVYVEWDTDEYNSRPIDLVKVEYALAVPDSSSWSSGGVKKASINPPNIDSGSWNDGGSVANTYDRYGDQDGLTFHFDGEILDDNCVFVRVSTKHDNKLSPSSIVFASNGRGDLAAPSNLNVTMDPNLVNVANVTATNNSQVAASYLGIYCRTNKNYNPKLIGVIPSGSSGPVSVRFPTLKTSEVVSFGVRAFVGDYSPTSPKPVEEGVTYYQRANTLMSSSKIIWDDSPVPKPPSNITLDSPRDGVARISWDWPWTAANGAEISWANHYDAWESTDGPQTYNLDNTKANAWNIAGLSTGTWYFRVRLYLTDASGTTYGTYSARHKIKMAPTPSKPVLTLSQDTVLRKGSLTCYWSFNPKDNDAQTEAQICEATIDSNGNYTYGKPFTKVKGRKQYQKIDVSKQKWYSGTKHYLSVRIITKSGERSDWSTPKAVEILTPITASIDSTSFVDVYEYDNNGITETVYKRENGTYYWIDANEVVHNVEEADLVTTKVLTTFPISVTASGAGEGGTITYIIERAADYHLYRPDESESTGFGGETVAIKRKKAINNGEDVPDNYSVTIYRSNLIPGYLDDGASYNLIAIAEDVHGQTSEAIVPFEVHWAHQAQVPEAVISPDEDSLVTLITPTPHEDYLGGDTCDIYRLSTDKPELIYKSAIFGTTYVDPYPALGRMGGHRIVFKTYNGDYITEDDKFAWTDYNYTTGDILDVFATVIDFGDNRVILPYDLSLSNKWSKDFTMTKYLGGSVEGDWNPAVERTGTVNTRVAVKEDSDMIVLLRRLANYSGICHVRTPDGSSFAANIDVSEEREEQMINKIASFSLDITRIDSEGFDGVTYAEWIKNN